MADLTTLAALKDYLGEDVATSRYDALLTRLVSSASAAFVQETGNPILKATYTAEVYSTRDVSRQGRFLRLRQEPVISVASVTLSGNTLAKRVAVGDGGWYQDGDGIRFEIWPFAATVGAFYGYGDLAVTYDAGYVTVPPDVEQAILEMAATEYHKRDRLGVTARSISGESITYLQYEYSLAVKMTIDNYTREAAA
jgi:uncharacterized phiE125 gp8 family phage protein